MAKSTQEITLSQSRDIPFNKLVLSQANVRRIKAGVSIEELAEDIARRTLLQSLTVRPVLDDDGAETGMFEIPAGGRRYRALELLVKQKRLGRTAPIPCVIRTGGLAEEDSLAENVQRAPLHPLDQFRAFLSLREKGMSEEEIAAAFFVSVQVVKQRLKLASVAPKLLDIYSEDGMTLDQLMAFTLNPDHERQEQVWEALQRSHNKEPYYMLPPGPKVALTGGLDFNDHHLIWDRLDKVHAKYPDMVLVHGGSTKGAELIAAKWATNRKVPQIAFKPDWTKHAKAAPFKRNDAVLALLPIGVMHFPGTGIQDNLADKARKLGIPVWKFGNGGA